VCVLGSLLKKRRKTNVLQRADAERAAAVQMHQRRCTGARARALMDLETWWRTDGLTDGQLSLLGICRQTRRQTNGAQTRTECE